MSLLQYAESGGEIYLPFARKKLRDYHAEMLRAGTRILSKTIQVSDGATIYIDSLLLGNGDFRDKIRITGSAQNGHLLRRTLGGTGPYIAYLVSGNRLFRYGVSDAASYNSFAFNGGTFAWYDTAAGASTSVEISRRNRASQVVTAVAQSSAQFSEAPVIAFETNILTGPVRDLQATHTPVVSRDGRHVVILGGTRTFPEVYRISAAQEAQEALPPDQWTGATEFDRVLYGEPSFVADLHAELDANQGRRYAHAAPNPAEEVLWKRVHYDSGVPYYARLDHAEAPDGLTFIPGYDYANDKLTMTVRMLHVSREATVGAGPVDVYVYHDMEIVLFQLDYSTLEWAEVSRRAEAEVGYNTWQEAAGGGFNGLTGTDGTVDGITVRYRVAGSPFSPIFPQLYVTADAAVARGAGASLVWVVKDATRDIVAGPPPTGTGAVSGDTGDQVVYKDGAEVSRLPGLSTPTVITTVCAWGEAGRVCVSGSTLLWSYGLTATDCLDFTSLVTNYRYGRLSETGHQMWMDTTGVSDEMRLYRDGVLLVTFGAPAVLVDPPTATEFAAYPAAPPEGAWFVDHIAWSTTADVAKIKRYKYVIELTAPVGGSQEMYAGDYAYDGDGPTAFSDGSPGPYYYPPDTSLVYVVGTDVGGTGLWVTDVLGGNLTFLTEAQLESAYGGLNITINQTGGPYTYSGGGAPGVYEWATDTVQVKWSDSLGALQVLKTYPETGVSTPEDPSDSGSTPLDLSGALLVQDEYLLHRA